MNLYSTQKMHLHAVSTLRTLNTCRKNNFLCDFTVLVNNKAFRLHRVVLASCSEYFNAMFTHDTKELREGYSRMTDLDTEAIGQCIEFMYTGQAAPTLENAQPLLHASCLLRLTGLSELCFEKLMTEIRLENCLFIKQLAHTYNGRELEAATDIFVLGHFDSVMNEISFVDLKMEDLVKYLKSNEIQISSVISMWRATLKWICYDPKNRKKYFCDFLQLLKLEEYPEQFIRITIWKDELVQESKACKTTVAEALFKTIHDPSREDVVNIQSCLFIKELGREYTCREAENVADKFVLENFDDVITQHGFKYLDKCDVIRYIRSPDVCYSSEISLWQAVLTWIEHDFGRRTALFPDMLQYVKLEKMPSDFLQNTVRNSELVKASAICKDMLMDALFRQVTKAEKSGIAVIDRSSKVLKSYDPASSQWNDVENVKIGFSFTDSCVFAFVIEKYLYVLIKKALHRISWREKQSEWAEMASMHAKRDSGTSAVALGRFIYVIDGRSIPVTETGNPILASKQGRHSKKSASKSGTNTNSCGECFDSLLNTWSHMGVMPTPRANGCLATCDDVIYLIGGKVLDRKETNWLGMDIPTTVVECYVPVSKTWTGSVPMITGRYDSASAVSSGRIFVLGGVGQHGRVKDVEAYDTVTKTWATIASMTVPRSYFSACVIDGAIYAVGGDYRKDAYDKTIELFDPHKIRWEVVKKLNMKIFDNAAVVISLEQ